MQYRVAAYKCKVNSIIELTDDVVPVGAVYEAGDLFIVCLDPLEEKKLPEENKGAGVVREEASGTEEEGKENTGASESTD